MKSPGERIETAAGGSDPKTFELSEFEEALYRLIVPRYEAGRIQLTEFADLYKPEIIQADLNSIRRLRERHQAKYRLEGAKAEPLKKRGELTEALVAQQINKSEWFGRGVEAIGASEYDDLINYVDLIIEPKSGADRSRFALAVDVTESAKLLDHKFEGIAESIRRGELS